MLNCRIYVFPESFEQDTNNWSTRYKQVVHMSVIGYPDIWFLNLALYPGLPSQILSTSLGGSA